MQQNREEFSEMNFLTNFGITTFKPKYRIAYFGAQEQHWR